MNVTVDGTSYIPAPEQPEVSSLSWDEQRLLASVLDSEGLDAALSKYSSFDHGRNLVECKRFHQLRRAFLNARQDMTAYLEKHGIDSY